jgi:hypothetical protein
MSEILFQRSCGSHEADGKCNIVLVLLCAEVKNIGECLIFLAFKYQLETCPQKHLFTSQSPSKSAAFDGIIDGADAFKANGNVGRVGHR